MDLSGMPASEEKSQYSGWLSAGEDAIAPAPPFNRCKQQGRRYGGCSGAIRRMRRAPFSRYGPLALEVDLEVDGPQESP